MTDELTNDSLKNILGMSVSVISSEHFFSAGLSSPWSVAKFAETPEDKEQVWHYFNEAASASMIFGGIVSYMLRSLYPIASSGLTILYYRRLYKDALEKAPSQGSPIPDPWTPLTEQQMDDIRKITDQN